MGSPNLNVGYVSPNSNSKEVQHNAQVDKIDSATQGQLAAAFASNQRTLTADEFTSSLEFVVGTLSATGTLTIPLSLRLFVVDNRGSGHDVVVKGSSGTTATVGSGGVSLLRSGASGVYEFVALSGGAVDSVAGHTGIVSLANLVSSGLAPSDGPTLTGTVDGSGADAVLVPTMALGDSSDAAASTEFVQKTLNEQVVKPAADLATAVALPACAYVNGTGGVGATLIGTSNGALTVDGVVVTVDKRVLVLMESSQLRNGLYSVAVVGDGSTPFSLVRDEAMDEPFEFPGALVTVLTGGATMAGVTWTCTVSSGMTVGTTAVTFQSILSSEAGVDYPGLPVEVQNVLMTVSLSGKPGPGRKVLIPVGMDMVLPADFTGTQGLATATATVDADINVGYIRSGTLHAIGTITFESGSLIPTLSTHAAVTLTATDTFEFAFPAPQDNTWSDPALTLLLKKV